MEKETFINLTGNQYGRLRVLERAKDYIAPSGRHHTAWNCICSCGSILIVTGVRLKRGTTTSCGCFGKESRSKRSLNDLTGKRFGYLIVLRRAENDYITNKGKHYPMWNCLCDCGGETIITGANLRSGDTKSCGCLYTQSYIASELKTYFKKNYNAKAEYKIFKNLGTNRFLPYDIYIPYGDNIEINGYYIEINGIQHYISGKFKQTAEDFENQKKKDRMKRKFARKNGTYIEIDLRKNKSAEEWIEYIEQIIQNV